MLLSDEMMLVNERAQDDLPPIKNDRIVVPRYPSYEHYLTICREQLMPDNEVSGYGNQIECW